MMVFGQEPIYGGTLNTPLSADAHALNPFTWGTTYEAYVMGHIYDALVQLDTERQPVPVLCSGWTHNETYEQWTFTLKDNTYWHDGTPLTIDDVYYTYDLLVNDPAIPRRSWLFDEVVDLQIIGTNQIQVTFGWGPKPADVLFDLATTWIVPEHIWDAVDLYTFANDVNPIGSGPFEFVEWQRGQYFTLKRNDVYYLDGPYVEYKVLPIISEVEVAYYELSLGNIENMANPPPELEAVAEVDPLIEIHEALQDYWVYLGLNHRRYPNNVTEFRQAVLYGINRSEIVDLIRFGRGDIMPASCSLPYGPYYNPDIPEYEYNVTKANEMLDALGWVDTDLDDIREDGEGNPLEFDVIVSADAQVSVDSCLFIKGYMEDIGIDVTVVPLIWDVLWQTVGGTGDPGNTWDYDWCFLGWVGFWSDFHPSWMRWLFSANGWWGSDDVNIPGWNSTSRWEVTDLADQILYSTNETEIKELIDEAQLLVAEDLPYLPINVLGGTYLYRIDEFKDWVLGPTTGPDNWMTWLSIQLIVPPDSGPGFLALSAILAIVLVVGVNRFKRKK
jgi:peptide/nickel transport system substrate-binding protein